MTRARRKFGWLLLASAGRCALVDPGKLAASVAILHRLKPVPPTAAKYLVKSGTRFSLCLLAEKEEPVANRIDQAVGNFKPATFGRYPISGRSFDPQRGAYVHAASRFRQARAQTRV